MDRSTLIVVQAFGKEIEANLARSLLESAGIDAMVQADRAGGMRDHLAWSGFGFKVMVREEDLEEARQILHPLHKAPEGKLVIAQWCGTQEEADVAQGVLESAGISAAVEPVRVDNNSPLSLMESLSLMDPVFRVLVAEKDAMAARELLNQSEETNA